MTEARERFLGLVRAASPFLRLSPEECAERLSGWLGHPSPRSIAPERSSRSCLNSNRYPIQLCLSVRSGHPPKARCIVDPGFWEEDPHARLTLARQGFAAALADCGAQGLAPTATALLDELLGPDPSELTARDMGVFWIAGCPGANGAGLYTDMALRGQTPDRAWAAARRILARLLPRPDEALAVVDRLDGPALLASLALEGLDAARGRCKLYFRLAGPTRLHNLGLPDLAGPPMAAFAAHFLGARDIRRSGLVLAVGFDLASGVLADVKLDLCGCPRCLGHPGSPETPALDWPEALRSFARSINANDRFESGNDRGASPTLDLEPLARIAARPELEVAFIGQGLSVAGERRINLYLAPRLTIRNQPTTQNH